MKHWNSIGLPTMLVVDECHWAGSEYNRGVFEGDARWRLGLSATPERGDDGYDEVLVPELGGIVYRYSLKDAMDDGVLADFRLVNLLVDLTRSELSEYNGSSSGSAGSNRTSARSVPNSSRTGLDGWCRTRRPRTTPWPRASRLSSVSAAGCWREALGRFVMVKRLLEAGEFAGRRTIVFNETIEQAEQSRIWFVRPVSR